MRHEEMKCEEFETAWNAQLDGEDPGCSEADLQNHRSSCPACAVLAAELEIIDKGLRVRAQHWQASGTAESQLFGQLPQPARKYPWAWSLAAAILLAFVSVAVWPTGHPGWSYDRVDAKGISWEQRLRPGQWLEAGPGQPLRLDVADIGEVTLDPGARLQLVRTDEQEHRLRLERGQIHAFVLAPPRLFLVETPATLAVDLGCAYTLSVEPDGGTRLAVTSGQVALESARGSVVVTAGQICLFAADGTPGVPFAVDEFDDFK